MLLRHGIASTGRLLSLATLTLIAGLTGCQSVNDNQDESVLAPILKSIAPPTPGQAARQAFNIYDPDKRRNSIGLLSQARFGGEEAYVRLYRLLVDDPDASVRAAAIKALGYHGTADDVSLILPYLQDNASFVRWETAQSLQKLHGDQAIDPLIKALGQDEDADVRMASATALGQYAQPRVFQSLVGALNDSDYGVVDAAQNALTKLTGEAHLGSDGTMWILWSQRRSGNLFEHQQVYQWQPFNKPTRWWQDAQFWRDDSPLPPRRPAGIASAP